MRPAGFDFVFFFVCVALLCEVFPSASARSVHTLLLPEPSVRGNGNDPQSPSELQQLSTRSLSPQIPSRPVPRAVKHRGRFMRGLWGAFLSFSGALLPRQHEAPGPGRVLEPLLTLPSLLLSLPGAGTSRTAGTIVESLPSWTLSSTGTSTLPGCSWKNTG